MRSNETHYYYDRLTGVFSGNSRSGPIEWLEKNKPDGFDAWPEWVDHLCQKVDISTGLLVDYQPPAPAADEFTQWTWDAGSKRWQASPTLAGRWRVVRNERDRRLAASDWIVTKSAEAGTATPTAWRTYRQALRDVPANNSDPANIAWPAPPA
jgi:hypothetical protein